MNRIKIDWFDTERSQNTIIDLETEIAKLKEEIKEKDIEIERLKENNFVLEKELNNALDQLDYFDY